MGDPAGDLPFTWEMCCTAADTGSPSAGSKTKCSPKSQNSCLERTDGVLSEEMPHQAAPALPCPAQAVQPHQCTGDMGCSAVLGALGTRRPTASAGLHETPYPASPLVSATMKQMPRAWQKSPTRSCSSSGDSVSTTTCARSVSECCHPGAPHGTGMQAHLEGVKEGLRQLPAVSFDHHMGVQLSQGLLGCLGTVLA